MEDRRFGRPPQRHHDVLGVRVRRARELRGPVAKLEVQGAVLALHDHVSPIRRHLRERDERPRGRQAQRFRIVVRSSSLRGVGEQRRHGASWAATVGSRAMTCRSISRSALSQQTMISAASTNLQSVALLSDSLNNNDDSELTK